MSAWFKPKRIGWGFTPATWQGWLVTAAFVGIVLVLAVTLAGTQPWIFLTLLAVAVVVFLLIGFLKR